MYRSLIIILIIRMYYIFATQNLPGGLQRRSSHVRGNNGEEIKIRSLTLELELEIIKSDLITKKRRTRQTK